MRYLTIPRTDLTVSCLCLGAGSFGDSIPEPHALSILDRFVEAGGTFIDTANVYGKWLPAATNESERLLGRWLRTLPPSVSSRLIVATKGAHPPLSDMGRSRMDRASIASDLDESLTALGLDRIDLYWIHRDDLAQEPGAIIELLETFVAEGRIRWYGCSNWQADRIAAANDHAAARGRQGFSAVQNRWSYARMSPQGTPDATLVAMDEALYELHRRTGLASIPYSAMAKGYFTKRSAAAASGTDLPERLIRYYGSDMNDRRHAALTALSAEKGLPVSQLSLAYLTSQPFATIPIASFPTMAQLEDALAAADLLLTSAEVARLACREPW